MGQHGRRTAEREAEAAADDTGRRLCAATRAARDPDELIRFVADPDGRLVPDVARRLPGRGVWVGADRASIEKAIKTKAFARSLKRQVTVPEGLADMIEAQLVRRLCDALALANKAGLVSTGFEQVDKLVEGGKAAALLHGSDAAAGGRAKLDRKFEAVARDRGTAARIVDALTIDQISLAMGRSNVVHAGLIQGGATTRFLSEAERVERFRSGFGAFSLAEAAPSANAAPLANANPNAAEMAAAAATADQIECETDNE